MQVSYHGSIMLMRLTLHSSGNGLVSYYLNLVLNGVGIIKLILRWSSTAACRQVNNADDRFGIISWQFFRSSIFSWHLGLLCSSTLYVVGVSSSSLTLECLAASDPLILYSSLVLFMDYHNGHVQHNGRCGGCER